MKEKELVVYKENFISRIKNFFKNIFRKKKQPENGIIETHDIEEIEESIKNDKNNFLTEIKVAVHDGNNVFLMKTFLDEIDGNVEKLNMLSIDRLEKLEKYYDKVIEENNRKIEKLKKAV